MTFTAVSVDEIICMAAKNLIYYPHSGRRRWRGIMTQRKRRYLGITVVCTGAVLMLIGIFRGEMNTLLKKAVLICLECIGIG